MWPETKVFAFGNPFILAPDHSWSPTLRCLILQIALMLSGIFHGSHFMAPDKARNVKNSSFGNISLLLHIFLTLRALSGPKNGNHKKSHTTFVSSMKSDNWAKSEAPGLIRCQTKWISECENLIFWPNFSGLLVNKCVQGPTSTGRTSTID